MTAIAAAPRLRLVASQGVTDIPNAEAHQPTRRGPIDASASDEVLVRAIGQGDRAAMGVLFRRHQTRIYRFILRMVRDSASAEDVLSDVFLSVWRHADRFAGRSSVSTWLLGIARHKALTATSEQNSSERFQRERKSSNAATPSSMSSQAQLSTADCAS